MDTETLKRWTTEVKETLAAGIGGTAQKKQFTAVNLWKIQQSKRKPTRITRKWAI